MNYQFKDIDGEENQVEMEILHSEDSHRPYGIKARIFRNGELQEVAEAKERFYSITEAEKTMEMLCRFQVTPCTLCDII